MSAEARNLLIRLDGSDVYTKLALQCAPVIAGVKISNLLVAEQSCVPQLIRYFAGTGIELYVFCVIKGTAYMILYRRRRLGRCLRAAGTAAMMRRFGYGDLSVSGVLRTLGRRYALYHRGLRPFPHEMGLVLGYPPRDVEGFIENGGQGFLLCGYWKVYGDAARAERIFRAFDQTKETAVRLLAEGRSLMELMDAGLKPVVRY